MNTAESSENDSPAQFAHPSTYVRENNTSTARVARLSMAGVSEPIDDADELAYDSHDNTAEHSDKEPCTDSNSRPEPW